MEIEDEGAINLSTASSVPPASRKADVPSPSVMVNGDIRHSASENGDSHPQVAVLLFIIFCGFIETCFVIMLLGMEIFFFSYLTWEELTIITYNVTYPL